MSRKCVIHHVHGLLVRHRILKGDGKLSRAPRGQYLTALSAFIAVAVVFVLLGLNIFLFGSGFGQEPVQYVAASGCLAIAAAIILMLGAGAVNRHEQKHHQ